MLKKDLTITMVIINYIYISQNILYPIILSLKILNSYFEKKTCEVKGRYKL